MSSCRATNAKDMTPAQLQAWEHFSGTSTLNVRFSNGDVGLVSVESAGLTPNKKSLAWLREKAFKVIPKVIHPDLTEEDQMKMVPADLLSDDQEPVLVWKLIVKQNKKRAREFSLGTAQMSTTPGPWSGQPGFDELMLGTAVQNLFELEKQIIQLELSKKQDTLETLEEVREEYVAHLAEMKEALGDRFQAIYDAAKASHNECERTNLDNTKGLLYCFVLPKFNADGSHEPIGPRDYPYGNEEYSHAG